MANTNGTLSRTQSKPELAAQWLFISAGQFRNLLAFALITALTVISITFNIELGKLAAVDEVSSRLLPSGYALLDLGTLFLSSYVGIKNNSTGFKILGRGWFIFLLCLSLWAAASFTLSVDARAASSDILHAIEQKTIEVESLNADVKTWQANVAEAVNFKTKHQNTLNQVQAKQLQAADELHTLESNLPNPTMAIYQLIAPVFGVQPTVLNTLVRLLWAAALTLSPIVIMLLIGTEFTSKKAVKNRQDERQTQRHDQSTLTEKRATQATSAALVVPVKGHNGTTPVDHLNGLKYCIEWLKKQPAGAVTRAKIGLVSKIKNRNGVTKIINALLDQGRLIKLNNGKLSKPSKPRLTLVKK